MDQQTQPQLSQQPAPQQPPVQQPQAAPVSPAPEQKKKPIWPWILGGCLGIIIIGMLIMGGLAWWGAKKIKKVIKENPQQVEEWQQKSQELQKQMEKAQEMQKNLPQNSPPQ